MTVLNFPAPSASPYEVNGVRYTWDGEAWVAAGGGDTYLKVTGGNITGAITSVEAEITSSWDLSDGPSLCSMVARFLPLRMVLLERVD